MVKWWWCVEKENVFPGLFLLLYKILYLWASDHPKTSLALGKWNKLLPLTLKGKHYKNVTEVRAPSLFWSDLKRKSVNRNLTAWNDDQEMVKGHARDETFFGLIPSTFPLLSLARIEKILDLQLPFSRNLQREAYVWHYENFSFCGKLLEPGKQHLPFLKKEVLPLIHFPSLI